ncbi:MAG: IS982 family transposase [Nitrospirota bacterium]
MTTDLDTKLIEIFCKVDDFCKKISSATEQGLKQISSKKHRNRKGKLSMSEIITILIFYQLYGAEDFKHFYLNTLKRHYQKDFPDLVSYARFVRLIPRALTPLLLFLKHTRMGINSGISFIDSTALKVCHNKRIFRHKIFRGMAQRGKTTMGWFFGFKLHLIVNDKGELLSFYLTAGNISDRDKNLVLRLTKGLWGKLFGDKGYIHQQLVELLLEKSIHLITGIRNNMKNKLMPLIDKILLRKRSIIECVNDELKNNCQIEHTRHRSIPNFLVHLFSALTAYTFLPKKPSLKFKTQFLMAA